MATKKEIAVKTSTDSARRDSPRSTTDIVQPASNIGTMNIKHPCISLHRTSLVDQLHVFWIGLHPPTSCSAAPCSSKPLLLRPPVAPDPELPGRTEPRQGQSEASGEQEREIGMEASPRIPTRDVYRPRTGGVGPGHPGSKQSRNQTRNKWMFPPNRPHSRLRHVLTCAKNITHWKKIRVSSTKKGLSTSMRF